MSKKLDVIKNYYQISNSKAKEYMELLSDKEVQNLKKRMNTGGGDNE